MLLKGEWSLSFAIEVIFFCWVCLGMVLVWFGLCKVGNVWRRKWFFFFVKREYLRFFFRRSKEVLLWKVVFVGFLNYTIVGFIVSSIDVFFGGGRVFF